MGAYLGRPPNPVLPDPQQSRNGLDVLLNVLVEYQARLQCHWALAIRPVLRPALPRGTYYILLVSCPYQVNPHLVNHHPVL